MPLRLGNGGFRMFLPRWLLSLTSRNETDYEFFSHLPSVKDLLVAQQKRHRFPRLGSNRPTLVKRAATTCGLMKVRFLHKTKKSRLEGIAFGASFAF
jgi:hypothetical protein